MERVSKLSKGCVSGGGLVLRMPEQSLAYRYFAILLSCLLRVSLQLGIKCRVGKHVCNSFGVLAPPDSKNELLKCCAFRIFCTTHILQRNGYYVKTGTLI